MESLTLDSYLASRLTTEENLHEDVEEPTSATTETQAKPSAGPFGSVPPGLQGLR